MRAHQSGGLADVRGGWLRSEPLALPRLWLQPDRGGVVKRYRVLVELTYPTPATVTLPREKWVRKTAAVGAIVSDIPATSIPWLLEQGQIEEVKGKGGGA